MAISLKRQLEELVARKVASGLYDSPADVLETALRLLEERDADRARRLEQLRADVAAGLEQADAGLCRPVDLEELKARARKQFVA